jgi:hypothetical protein
MDCWYIGTAIEIRIDMMLITIISSIKVNPSWLRRRDGRCL